MRPALTATAMIVWVALGPAQAQSDDPQDALYDLATIEADHEICGFPLSDEQQEVIAQRREALVTRGDVSETEATTVREQVATAIRRQEAEGLCRQDGAEARLYKRRLTDLGLL